VVLGLLCCERNLIDKLHRDHEVFELIGALDRLADMRPFGTIREGGFDLSVGQFGHDGVRMQKHGPTVEL
jgi:hypothetical protein